MPDTLAAAVCFPGAVTAALLHTLPNINSTTHCLPPPTPLSSTKHKQAVLSQLLCMCSAFHVCSVCLQAKSLEWKCKENHEKGVAFLFANFKSITCPISSPTSPRRPVCTILFWVRVNDHPSLCQSKPNFYFSLFLRNYLASYNFSGW